MKRLRLIGRPQEERLCLFREKSRVIRRSPKFKIIA